MHLDRNKRVVLPLVKEPMYDHFSIIALAYGALEACYPYIEQLYFNYYSLCRFVHDKKRPPIIIGDPYKGVLCLSEYFGVLNRESNLGLLNSAEDDICDYLVQELEANRYCVVHYDDYYLEGRPGYGKRHILHDVSVYGCSGEAYLVMYHGSNGCLIRKWIPKARFRIGFSYLCGGGRDSNGLRDDELAPYSLSVVKNRIIEYDVKTVLRDFESYLDGPRDDEKTGLSDYSGWGVHVGLADYINSFAGGSILGWIFRRRKGFVFTPMRQFWESKKCMSFRFKKLSEFDLIPEKWVNEYRLVEESSRKLLFKCWDYGSGNSGDLKCMLDMLEKIKEVEVELIEKVVGRLS